MCSFLCHLACFTLMHFSLSILQIRKLDDSLFRNAFSRAYIRVCPLVFLNLVLEIAKMPGMISIWLWNYVDLLFYYSWGSMMLDHEAEAVAARTREAPVTAGAGVRSTYTCSQIWHPSFFAPILICCFLLRSVSRSPSPVDERYVNLYWWEMCICEIVSASVGSACYACKFIVRRKMILSTYSANKRWKQSDVLCHL